MVLDYLLSPHQARKDPWSLAIAAMLFVSFGVIIDVLMPSVHGSIIIFAMLPAIPLLWMLMVREEVEEEKDNLLGHAGYYHKHGFLGSIKPHGSLWEILAFFFLGAVIAYTFWYAALPAETSQQMFADQINEVKLIQGAMATAATGNMFTEGKFWFLFEHNLQVLGIMFVFCLLYGIGSVYMLMWNASIIGVVLGGKIATEGIPGVVVGFLGLLPHGIFEISAYFVATIAGGIFSVSLMRGVTKPGFRYVLYDVLFWTGLSLALLAIGAAIEASY